MTEIMQMEALWRFKQKKLSKEIENFVKNWNRKHKCKCCFEWKEGDYLIECKHVEKEKIKKYGERILAQFRTAGFIGAFSLKQLLEH